LASESYQALRSRSGHPWPHFSMSFVERTLKIKSERADAVG
jgi:hypothetical protein